MEGLAWVGVGLAVYAGCAPLVSARCQRVMIDVHIVVEVSGESIGRQTVEGQRRVRVLMIQIGKQGYTATVGKRKSYTYTVLEGRVQVTSTVSKERSE